MRPCNVVCVRRCFLNSILSSLQHAPILTTYFLSGTYLKEINRSNPLGWNGRIAEEYATLLQQYWSNRYTVVAPRAFKQALGEFQPRFSGYQQHDSQELLSFLLDGLHEDLNRVLRKPATQGVESGGREDEEVAREAWAVYKLRNQSVVVDHMMGQLKSRVVCPQPGCGHVSITFDPYCTLSLPLPTVNDHVQALYVVYADPSRPITRVHVVTSKVAPLSELRASLSSATGVAAARFVLADVWAHRLYRVLDDDSSVSDIRAADLIYAYELPALDHIKPADVVLAQIVHQKVAPDSASILYGPRMRQEVFGLPRVIALSRKDMVTGKQVAAEIDRLMDGWVKEAADDEAEVAAATTAEGEQQQVEGQPSTGLDMLLDATEKRGEGEASAAAAESEGGVTGEMETNEQAEGELVGDTQMEGEEGRERDRDSAQSSAESTDSNGYVIVKSPQDDAIMTTGEGEGEGVEGDTAADADGVRSASPSPPPPAYAHPASLPDDPSRPYRIVQLDSDGRHCLRCPLSTHCTGCALPIDDETMALPSTAASSYASSYSYSSFDRAEPKLVFGIEWTERSARRYNDARESVDTGATDSSSSSHAASAAGEQRVALSDCLAAFCKEETLSEQDPWYCSRCADFRCARKKMDLFSLPDLLVLHLKRFAYTARSREKISTLVHFPVSGLDLSHIGGRGGEGAGGVYDLFAVSNHMGGLGGGHYTAYVKNRVAGGWYLHDDSRVSEVSEDEIVSSSAYVLFYRRRGVKDGMEGAAAAGADGAGGEEAMKGEEAEGEGTSGYAELDDDGVPKAGGSSGLIDDHFGVKQQAGGDVEG